MRLYVLLFSVSFILFSSSCQKLEYSPNQKFDKNTPRNINASNLQKLLANPGDDTIRFVISGDSQNAYNDLGAFIKKVNETPGIDFVILNGDISDFGLLQEFKWIESYFSKLNVPHLAVIGNHDHSANGVYVYQRMYSEKLDFSFIYKGVKFVCHNTNSREYNFNGTIPNLNYLASQFQPEAGVNGYFAVAHVPPTNGDFDKKLFAEYGKILTDNGKVYAVLNAHIDKETIQFPYTPDLPVITTNSLYNRHFLIAEVITIISSTMMLNFRKSLGCFVCLLFLFSNRLNAQKFLIPQTAMVQRAGSIGFNSFGVGYNLFGNQKGSLDLAWGYVPKSKGGRQDIFAAKFAYRPLNIKLNDFGVLNLINPGVFVTHHPGGKFHTTFDKDQYPDGYYWWSSAVKFHLSLSTELKINTPKPLAKTGVEQIALYGEFNTNELYFVSWFRNRDKLPFADILKLGFGVKAYF